MSSKRKRASARANGVKSDGPVTREGRQNSARANFKHGLTARTVCLTNEDEPVFLEMIQQYTDHFQPIGPVEHDLVHAMVVAKWQERRMWTIQTATLDLRMDLQTAEFDARYASFDRPTRLAIAFTTESAESKSLPLQLRYSDSHRRAYEKSLEILVKFQAGRTANTDFAEEPNPTIEHLPNQPAAPPSASTVTDPAPRNTDFPNEPSPKIEQLSDRAPIEPKLCECGRLTSPKWNRCDCGRVLRPAERIDK